MNRFIAVTATLAAASTATIVAAAAVVPAMAAPRPVTAHPAAAVSAPAAAASAASAVSAVQRAKLPGSPSSPPTIIGSELDGGKYVTVVGCHGVDSPPPVTLGKPGTPLTLHGTGPSAAILQMLKKPNPYKTIYVCAVVVMTKVPPKPKPKKAAPKPGCEIKTSGGKRCTRTVTLNTGFGGLAKQVTGHHPVG